VSEGVDTALTVTGLKSNTKYDLTVTAVDAAGNESERSTKVSVKTGSNSAVNLALLISLIVLATVIVAAIVYLLLRRYMRMKKAKQLFAEVGNSNLSGAENLPETGSEETDAGDNSQDDSAI
ncbi:MAG: fibronectin type III domain-containing protein, partial [Oscillospiraceae bacterium]